MLPTETIFSITDTIRTVLNTDSPERDIIVTLVDLIDETDLEERMHFAEELLNVAGRLRDQTDEEFTA